MKFFDDAKLKAGVWLRERKERAEAKKAASVDPVGVTIPLSLVRSAKLAAWMAYFSLVYFLWLYTLDIARDRAASLHLTHVGSWIGEVQFYFPYIVGFAVVAVGIPYVAKISIPTFMSLNWRDNFWPKLWALFIAAAVSVVVIAGTFTVQGDTILERDRASVVAVDQVAQEAAVLTARIADVQHAMDERTQSPSPYVRTAASMSPTAYDRFVAARAGDPQYQRLLSYRAVSEEMVDLNRQMADLRAQQARQTVVSQVQGRVTNTNNGWIAGTLGWLEGARAMLLSLVMDIVCLIMPWIALRLEQARNRQMGMAGGIPQHPWMLEKPREGERPMVRPEEFAGRRAQDVVDAMIAGGADPRFAADMARAAARATAPDELAFDEDGTPLTKVEYWKRQDGKPLVKNQRNKVVVTPGAPPPDERGVATDGGNRIGSIAEAINDLGMPIAEPSADAEQPQSDTERTQIDDNQQDAVDGAVDEIAPTAIEVLEQPDLPELSEEELAADAEIEAPEQENREPETDPAKLIAAE